MSGAWGARRWAIPGGHVPFGSTGPEPEFTSFDKLCILNLGEEDADVEMRFYFEDGDPAGPFRLRVRARRVRHVRVNDLIDPHALPLDTPYGCVVDASAPIVVQLVRQDTRQAANAVATAMAMPLDGGP